MADNDKTKINRFNTAILIMLGLFILSYLLVQVFGLSEKQFGNVAKIKINGIITSEEGNFLGETTLSSSDFRKFIEDAETKSSIKAILVEINSPGGSPVASAEIAESIAKAKKPVVALIREQGTSGAYWAASAADKIVAHPLSITGSIGVIGSYLQFSGFLERYNISYERLVAGQYKDIGSPLKELTNEEKKLLQGALDEIYYYFVVSVAHNRNISVEELEKIADGRFYTGMQAKKLGLIDELGGIDEAEELLKQLTNISEIHYVEYEKKRTLLDLFSGVLYYQSFAFGEGITRGILKEEATKRINMLSQY
ncbi:MAG: signal peptide peptidase SppA [Candidatus Woesearchaeota archaeon]